MEYCDAEIVAATTSNYSVSMRRTDLISLRIKAAIEQTLERLAKEGGATCRRWIELALEAHIEAIG